MSIASAIESAQQKVANAYTAVDNKGGTLPQTQNLANLPTAVNSIQGGGDVTSLSITPSTSSQSFTKAGEYDCYNPVTISAVTSAIDSNIQAKFIRSGTTILGVEGTYGNPYVEPNVFCSQNTTWYIKENTGDLYGCGSSGYGQQGSGGTSDITAFTNRGNALQVACSNYTTWYIDTNGDLYGCGRGAQGQQGNGGTSNVTTFTKRATGVKYVTCDYLGYATWYIDNNNNLYGCGYGSSGQQGNNSTSNVSYFTQRASNVKQVACSGETTWYITNDGDLYGCGDGDGGKQGNGATGDIKKFTLKASNIKDVVTAYSSTWYLTNDGILYGCGSSLCGQQSNGSTSETTLVTTFTQRATNVKEIAATSGMTWYIDNNGDLYGCGINTWGQQGSGTYGSSTHVTTFTKRASNVKKVMCNTGITTSPNLGITAYLDNNNDLYMAGSGGWGLPTYTTFTKIASNVKDFTAVNNSIWYIGTNNYLYGQGSGNYGMQGNGSTSNVTTFTQRANLGT